MRLIGIGVAIGCLASAPALAQNYGGIEGFTVKYPIPTYETPVKGQPLKASRKLIRKRDVGAIDDASILSVYGLNGNGFVELKLASGDYWVSRGHVKPKRAKLVDLAIDESNGVVGCPPGKTRVAIADDRNNTSGVARSLGGVSVFCE